MINDHSTGASCSIHGRSRVDESSEPCASHCPPEIDSVAAAISPIFHAFGKTPVTGPKIAILLCTYNGQHFLEQQLLSIQRQTWLNWQVVLSDDGSSDDTLAIARRYQRA